MAVFTPLNLKETCVNVIASNFNGFLRVLDSEDCSAEKYFLRLLFSDALFEKVKGPLEKGHASFFINSHLRKLDLNRFVARDIIAIIKRLKTKGHGILSLSLSNSRWPYPRTTVVRLAYALPSSLRLLQLHAIPYSHKLLTIVVKTCPNLQELELNSCDSVTDHAIKTAFSNSEPIMKKLLKLDLRKTNVTIKGIIWILRCCLNLNELAHQDVGAALSHIYDQYVKNDELPIQKYNLQFLHLKGVQELNAARLLCPYVKYLLVSCLSTQSEINICLEFERLKEVGLRFHTSLSLTSFFKARGSELEVVEISGNVIVPIQLLVQCCPKLKCLYLKVLGFESGERRLDTANCFLQNLKILKLCQLNPTEQMQHIVALFSCSPKIETLEICCTSDLTDSFIRAISRIDSLKDFYLCNCVIHVAALNELKIVASNKKCIFVQNCIAITREEFHNIEQLNHGLVYFDNGILYPPGS